MADGLRVAGCLLTLLALAGCFGDGGFARKATLTFHGDANGGDHEKVISCPSGAHTDLVVTLKGDTGRLFVVVSHTTGDSDGDGAVLPDEDRFDGELLAEHYVPTYAEQTYLESTNPIGFAEDEGEVDYRLFVERSDPFHGKYTVTLECA